MAAKRTLLYYLLFCQIFGIAIFLKGFFPLKKNSSGFSVTNEHGRVVHGKFDRLIIIMIDALRADFVFGDSSYMSFTNKLIVNGDTFRFVKLNCRYEEMADRDRQAHSNPPTVTMPRIKAITTGTIPGFIDVILNVDSKELSEDNLVTQMKNSNKKIVFYGDDTWIKLFPNHFVRHDGTTSFFVTDYTEVDNNVTRHVAPEINRTDWDVMILHYLGLDHIGHLAGPNSPLVQPKLIEMDEIIADMYKTTLQQDHQRNISTLLILCGDHGMSDGGSHGGSSPAETTTPLVFMSSLYDQGKGKSYEGRKVDQIDIAPTLAMLFGLSIPKNSIGIIVPDLLTQHSFKERLEALRINALQIYEVYQSNKDNESVVDLNLAKRLHEEWLRDYHNKGRTTIDMDVRAEKISKLYYSGMQEMTQKLTKFMSSYDFYALYIGIWFLLQSLLGGVCLNFNMFPHDAPNFAGLRVSTSSIAILIVASATGYLHIHLCSTQILGESEVFCAYSSLSFLFSSIFVLSTSIATLALISILVNIKFGLTSWFHASSLFNTKTVSFLVLGLLLHNISLLSTSFIEEEHQTWYFLTTTYHLVMLFDIYCKKWRTLHSYFNKKETPSDGSPVDATSSTRNFVENKSQNKVAEKHHRGGETDHDLKRTSAYMFILLLTNRTLRSWNQTGIKWADQPDVSDWLVKPQSKTVLSLLTIISLLAISLSIFNRMERNLYGLLMFAIFTAGEVCVYFYRASTDCVLLFWNTETPQTGIHFAQLVHLCVLALMMLEPLFQLLYHRIKGSSMQQTRTDGSVTGYVLLITLLLRTHNIPIIALMLLQHHIYRELLWKRCEGNLEIILSAYYLGWFTYFAQGNSNSLATVDIGAGYIGLGQNYWPALVALLTSLSTFSGPLFWLTQAAIFIHNKHDNKDRSSSKSDVRQVCNILLMIKSFNLTVCTVLSWLNCYHLFVWSVFSPKLLYEGVVSLIFGVFIFTVSTVTEF